MAGFRNRMQMIVHDGQRVVDDRPIPREFRNDVVLDVTRQMYKGSVKEKYYNGLGTELKSIGGVEAKNGDGGFQCYIAVLKGEKVLQMGLPFITTPSGEKVFLNAENLRPGNMDSLLKHLPSDTKIALVWRVDYGMTQDLLPTEKSIVTPLSPPSPLDLSISNEEPRGCGGTPSQKFDLVADFAEVSLYQGEVDNPIRMSTIVVTPPVAACWDSFEESLPTFPISVIPLVEIQPQNTQYQSDLGVSVMDHTLKTHWISIMGEGSAISSKHKHPYLLSVATFPKNMQEKVKTQTIAKNNVESSVCGHAHGSQSGFQLKASSLTNPIMNSTERKLWSKIYNLPLEEKPQPEMTKIDVQNHTSVPRKSGHSKLFFNVQMKDGIGVPKELKKGPVTSQQYSGFAFSPSPCQGSGCQLPHEISGSGITGINTDDNSGKKAKESCRPLRVKLIHIGLNSRNSKDKRSRKRQMKQKIKGDKGEKAKDNYTSKANIKGKKKVASLVGFGEKKKKSEGGKKALSKKRTLERGLINENVAKRKKKTERRKKAEVSRRDTSRKNLVASEKSKKKKVVSLLKLRKKTPIFFINEMLGLYTKRRKRKTTRRRNAVGSLR